MAIALNLVTERADHLRVADIAALADIDVASGKLQRRVGPHPFYLFDGVFEVEERCDLHDAANGNHRKGSNQQEACIGFKCSVLIENTHCTLSYSAGCIAGASAPMGTSSRKSPRMVL